MKKRYLIIYVTSLVIGVVYAWSVKSVHTKQLGLLNMSDIAFPIALAFYTHYFIESCDIKTRFKLALTSGLGYATGTIIFLKFIVHRTH